MTGLDPNAVYTAADVARLVFKRSPRWFYRHHKKLIAEHHFPRSISPIGAQRWHGDHLIAWLRTPNTARAIGAEPVKAHRPPPSAGNVLAFRTAQMRMTGASR